MPIFTDRVEAIWGAIENGQVTEVDEFMMNDVIEASRMVFDGVHDVRRAVLQIRKKSGRPLPIEIWQDLSDYYDTEVPTTDDECCSEFEPEAVHIETVCIELNRPPKVPMPEDNDDDGENT